MRGYHGIFAQVSFLRGNKSPGPQPALSTVVTSICHSVVIHPSVGTVSNRICTYARQVERRRGPSKEEKRLAYINHVVARDAF